MPGLDPDQHPSNFEDYVSPAERREQEASERVDSAFRGELDPLAAAKDPEEYSAALTRGQWKHFEENFLPYEDRALGMASNKGLDDAVSRRALADVTRAYGQSSGVSHKAHAGSYFTRVGGGAATKQQSMIQNRQGRELSRFGQQLTGDEAAHYDRQRGLSMAMDGTAAANSARRDMRDVRAHNQIQLGNLGQGLAIQSTDSLGQAGSMASQREHANDMARDQRRAQNRQTAVSAAATIGMMIA